jgi:hypothetical protein
VAEEQAVVREPRSAPPERAKPAKKRAAATAEPRARAALVPELSGRAAPRDGDELHDMFAPGAARERALLPIGSVGANESPILD